MIKLIHVTDSHLESSPGLQRHGLNTSDSFNSVIDFCLKRENSIDGLLFTGDIANEPAVDIYKQVIKIISQFSAPYLCLPGNHDSLALMSEAGLCNCEFLTGELEFEHWRVLAIDSTVPGEEGGLLSQARLALLDKALTQSVEKHILLCLHHPPYPIDSSWMDKIILDNGADLVNLLEQHPQVKVVVFGHVHQAFFHRHQHARGHTDYIATPSTCYQFLPKSDAVSYSDQPPAYRIFTLYNDGRYETSVIKVTACSPL